MWIVPFVMDRKGIPKHGEAVEYRFPLCVKISAQPVDMLQLFQQLRNTALTRSCTLVGEAGRHGADLACGKACRNEIADACCPAQVGFAVDAIAILRAAGVHKARLLVVAQYALRDPEPFGSFLDLHFDPFPRCPSALTLVSMSRLNFKNAAPIPQRMVIESRA